MNTTDPFDRLIVGVVVVLLLLLGGVVANGDRVGVSVLWVDPRTDRPYLRESGTMQIPQTTPFTVRFSEPIQPSSVILTFTPPIEGSIRWGSADQSVSFTPTTAFSAGVAYTVRLNGEGVAKSGRRIISPIEWQFTARLPAVVYLAPALPGTRREPTQLWRVSLTPPYTPQPLTTHALEINDYAVSPDGSRIAYSATDLTGRQNLYELTIGTGGIRPLTDCIGAACRAPEWSPDGTRLVYERANSTRLDSDSTAWLLELATLRSVPLFTRQDFLGHLPRWSRDGKVISLYDRNLRGIVVVTLGTGERTLIQTLENDSGSLSPDSSRIAYTSLVNTPRGILRRLEIATFNSPQRTIQVFDPQAGSETDTVGITWQPDGQALTVMHRELTGSRFSEKFQVYQLTPTGDSADPLIYDPIYAHGALQWRADGEQLIMQRFLYQQANATPGIWVYDKRSKTLTQIAENGFLPRWIP
jgi:Tol biopolymer transport system component